MGDRARRAKGGLDKFAEYRRVRDGGTRTYKEEEDVVLYDEVTEAQYKQIVGGRLQQDDFVVDDGVSGYMDNGMDDWGNGDIGIDEDEEDEHLFSGKKSGMKGKANKASKSRAKPKAPPPNVAPSIGAYRPAVSAEEEDDFMSNVLGGLEAAPIPGLTRKRKPSPKMDDLAEAASSPTPYRMRHNTSGQDKAFSSDGLLGDEFDSLPPSSDYEPDDEFESVMSPKKKVRMTNGFKGGLTPALERMEKLDVRSGSQDSSMDFEDFDMDAFNDLDEDVKPVIGSKFDAIPFKSDSKVANSQSAEFKKGKLYGDAGATSWLAVYDSLAVNSEDSLGSSNSPSVLTKVNVEVLEPNGELHFYWLDYLEHASQLFLIGKVKDKLTSSWVSACLTVDGLERNLFVLPRRLRVEQDAENEDAMFETDVIPTKADVYDDFDRIRRKMGIKSWKGRWVKRHYAFDGDVPKETEWLKVVYGFGEPVLPIDSCSPNISRIFGTNTNAFELFVLKRKIMGPCWLKIQQVRIENKGISWCKLEASVSDPKNVSPLPEGDFNTPRDVPPLTIMSLVVRTIVNHRENKREVVCVTGRIWRDVQLEDPTPPEQLPCSVHTLVRPLDRFPSKFEASARSNGRGIISPMRNERMLLNSLLVTIHKADPDVLVGHEFLGVSLDVLLGRMKDLKAEHWSRLGRFRRAKWPNIGRQGTNLKFLYGRLMCDLASDGARSMISSTTWSLTEMCKTHLKSDRQDIDPDDTASYFDGTVSSPERLMTFVRHCELDAHYQMAIASKVQILPLTKQLTNLAGNAWNKTLNGGRAERNEYILLHEFHRLKYICPDKTYGKKSLNVEAELDRDRYEAQEGGGSKGKGKKDKYKGGLVFEPKRGLWDKYILVMDFNSLYPSIIQEYNIDFTTVERETEENGEEKIPEPPASDVPQGVLPRLIATLVNRRRQVKSLMKDRTVSHVKLLQYDIKQQALKLTANSMYGCLGFEYSRFYARPLAALTTFKGREILTNTRELAESLQLDVVYGDTDSVFVNSNVTELSEALKISAEFKKAVNNRYKLLEIDLDGVFARLLLLQKKKYAAIKVEDGTRTSTEVKGLDMKRREYCALSKNVSQYVLDQILSGEATETVVERIHDYLTSIGEDVRKGVVKLDEFIIHKRLGKNPEDYPDAKTQPHVQVALRMKTRGGSARSGDVIPYVFCLGRGEESSTTAQAERARHPDEFRKAAEEFTIDFEYYLSQQVLPPIERLCDPIEGTDRARLAECLGLDPGRYRSTNVSESEARTAFSTLDSQTSDVERFRDAEPFIVRCRSCQGQIAFAPIWERESSLLLSSGPTCLSCHASISSISLQTQLEAQIRTFISRYYSGWTICDDPTCRHRTQAMGVYGRRCLRNKAGCRGSVQFEYSDVQLYNQLQYFAWLFDPIKIAQSTPGSAKYDEVDALLKINANVLQVMSMIVEKHISQCGRQWVDLGAIFSFMKL